MANTYVLSDEKYRKLVRKVQEEYYTHPAGPYKGTKSELSKDREYQAQKLIRNEQTVDYYGNAIQSAIDEANEAGGGKVIVPAGTYYTGALELKSNVELHLEKDTVLKFMRNKSNEYYPVVFMRWEGVEAMNFSPLVYAYEAENIALTGEGTLDGQADEFNWMPWKHGWFGEKDQEIVRSHLFELTEQNADVRTQRIFKDDVSTLRPPLIQPYFSKNILIQGVTLINSPFWNVNPVLCEHVHVDGIKINTLYYNNDGVDPESCDDVLIENVYFNTGDDCIALKSGRNNDGRRYGKPCQNVVIRNNKFANGHGGITIGSEISGGVRNVLAEHNVFSSKELNYPIRFKTNAERGGFVENITIRDAEIQQVIHATVHATMLYEKGHDGPYIPRFKNICLEDVTSNGGNYGVFMEAYDECPIEGLKFKNVTFEGVGTPLRAMNWGSDAVLENVKINGLLYPRPTETRILGIIAEGQTVKAATLFIGGSLEDIVYEWMIGDAKNGQYASAGTSDEFIITEGMKGKFLKLTATDKTGKQNESLPYEVLPAEEKYQNPDDAVMATARIISKGILDADKAGELSAPVTRREIAVMLAKLWNLPAAADKTAFADVEETAADYEAINAITAKGMMEAEKGVFAPNATLTREQMAEIVMNSCGVSYQNAMGTNRSTYADGDEIEFARYTDIERGTVLGLWKKPADNMFRPKQLLTREMAFILMSRISDFAGK